MNKERFKNNSVLEDQIDLIQLLKTFWRNKNAIASFIIVSVLIGLLIAFTSKTEYNASCKLLPESQNSSLDFGSLGGLAGLAGFDLSNHGNGGILSPELYPEIVQSTPFINRVLNFPIFFEKNDTTVSSRFYFEHIDSSTLFEHIAEYTIGLPGKLKSIFASNEATNLNKYDMIRFSKEDWKLFEDFKDRLAVNVDVKKGTILLSVEMPDPVAAAQLANLMLEELTISVIDYKIERAKINLEFINERFNESRNNYNLKQETLARFTDKNRNLSNSITQIEFERLQNEVDISFDVYKSLASQLEQAKIEVKEDTPIFTILEPVKIPVEKSKPKRVLILLLSFICGLVFGVTYVVIKTSLSKG
jgi:uncharacterized protein involved in exopolysaccharide biosynthesis